MSGVRLDTSLLTVALALMWAISAGAEDARDRAVQAIRVSLEQTGALPIDATMYAARISVSHNWDQPKSVEREVFIAGLSEELPLIAQILGKPEITRFITAGDTIIVTIRYAKATVKGEASPQIAFFLKLEGGRVVEEQVFADRGQLKPLIDALGSGSDGHADSERPLN
jgi:hypothetical protein